MASPDRIVGSILLVLLAACTQEAVYPPTVLPASAPLENPLAIDAPGTYWHVPSNLRFPATAGSFRRIALEQHDEAGLRVSGRYLASSDACPIGATLEVRPLPSIQVPRAALEDPGALEQQLLEAEHAEARDALLAELGDGAVVRDSPLARERTPGRSTIATAGGRQVELWQFAMGHTWSLRYRYDFPEPCAEAAHSELSRFMSGMRRTE